MNRHASIEKERKLRESKAMMVRRYKVNIKRKNKGRNKGSNSNKLETRKKHSK